MEFVASRVVLVKLCVGWEWMGNLFKEMFECVGRLTKSVVVEIEKDILGGAAKCR